MDQNEIVEVVLGAVAEAWKTEETDDYLSRLEFTLHGAGLAMLAAGHGGAANDFRFLSDLVSQIRIDPPVMPVIERENNDQG